MLFQKLRRRRDPETLNALSIAGTIGLHLASGVIVGSVLGYLLDKWLETAPWCFVAFMLAGIIAGFKNVYVDTKRLLELQYGPSARAGGTASAGEPPAAEELGHGKDAPSGPQASTEARKEEQEQA